MGPDEAFRRISQGLSRRLEMVRAMQPKETETMPSPLDRRVAALEAEVPGAAPIAHYTFRPHKASPERLAEWRPTSMLVKPQTRDCR
jgi:hypothetical protein